MLDAWSNEGAWPRPVVAGGKSKLPDLLGRQCKYSVEMAVKKVYVEVQDRLTMVDKANGRVIERQAWVL